MSAADRRRASLRGWALAALAGVSAVALRAMAQPLLGDHLPFVIAFPVTVISALFWGIGPALLTIAICAFAAGSPLIPPYVDALDQPMQIGGFVVAAIVIALLCGRSRAAHPADATAPAVPQDPGETPLTSWLRAALWGSFLIPATLFVVTAWWGYQRAQQDALASAARASELAYRQAQRAFEVASQIARRADAATTDADEQLRAQESALHQRLVDMTAGLSWIVNINVWDMDGHPLVGSDRYPVNRAATVVDRPYFREQRTSTGGAIGISEVVTGRQTGRELTNVVLRRSAPDGSFRGVVTVSMTPDLFSDYYKALANEASGLASFALVRVDGNVISHWAGSAEAAGRNFATRSEVQQRIDSGQREGSIMAASLEPGGTTILSFKRVDDFPIYIVAAFSHQRMMAGWTRFVALVAAILVPTTAGLVYVTWVALRRTRREQAIALALQEETRRRAAVERTMLESQKFETLAVLTGGVAHDFNNLLAVVHTSLHVLNRLHPALADTKQMQSVARAVQTGVRLTRQLLSFSRKQALRPEVIDLRQWLPSTETLAQSTLRSSVRWELELDPAPLPVEVDVGELELALINLVVNANLAMPDGGRITVSARAAPAAQDATDERSFITLSVRDTGVGIPPELLPKVCEPFFTTRSRGAGSGLGLSQVQGFCTRSGGRLRIDSIVGEGTAVHIELPRAAARAASSDPAAVATGEQFAGRVLLVEDNHEVAQTMESMLQSAGLEVTSVPNAAAALAVLDDTSSPPPDAVLSDIEMPGRVNGITLALSLRSRHPELPVILVTGYADQIDEATASGLNVMAKPVDPERLLDVLRTAIRHARQQSQLRT